VDYLSENAGRDILVLSADAVDMAVQMMHEAVKQQRYSFKDWRSAQLGNRKNQFQHQPM